MFLRPSSGKVQILAQCGKNDWMVYSGPTYSYFLCLCINSVYVQSQVQPLFPTKCISGTLGALQLFAATAYRAGTRVS